MLSKKELRARVLYSPAHIARLEKKGLFPLRVRLGPGRVGWVEDEIDQWLLDRAKARGTSGAGETLDVDTPKLKR